MIRSCFYFVTVGLISFIFSVKPLISFQNRFLFVFNRSGSLGILWSVIWMIFASDTPVKNSHISENEKEYIRVCKAEEKIQDHKTVRR